MFQFRIVLAALAFSTLLQAQSTSFSYTGTGLNLVAQNSTYTTNLSVFGSGTVTGLGQAEIRITASAVRERGLSCGNQLQADITFSLGANDTFTLTTFTTLSDLGKPVPAVITGSAGAYQGRGGSGTVTITQTSATTISLAVTGTLTAVGPAKPASIYPSGVVPLFSSVPIVQPGSWISVYGNNLANDTTLWKGTFVTDLGGVSVSIGGKPAFLYLVSPRQLNVQVPEIGTVGCANIIVTTPNGTAHSQVSLSTAQPSFSLLDAKYPAAIITAPDGSGAYGSGANSYDIAGPPNAFTFKTRLVKPGETLVLYGVGFGPTQQVATAGAFAAYPIFTKETPLVTIGGIASEVVFSGLVGAGLYQLNVKVPASLKSGDQPLIATVPGQPTPLLFSSFRTQNCADSDPQGPAPVNCAVYVAVQ